MAEKTASKERKQGQARASPASRPPVETVVSIPLDQRIHSPTIRSRSGMTMPCGRQYQSLSKDVDEDMLLEILKAKGLIT